MADDWIKLRHNIFRDPAVIWLSQKTGTKEEAIVGHLARLWCFFDEQTVDGHARGVTASWVDRHLGWQGFANLLVEVGWLEPKPDGISMPKFSRHMSQSAKRRALASKRQRKKRRHVSVTHKRDKSVTREEKREQSSLASLASLASELNNFDSKKWNDATHRSARAFHEMVRPMTQDEIHFVAVAAILNDLRPGLLKDMRAASKRVSPQKRYSFAWSCLAKYLGIEPKDVQTLLDAVERRQVASEAM